MPSHDKIDEVTKTAFCREYVAQAARTNFSEKLATSNPETLIFDLCLEYLDETATRSKVAGWAEIVEKLSLLAND